MDTDRALDAPLAPPAPHPAPAPASAMPETVRRGVVSALAAGAGVGLVGGVLTAYGQGWLPSSLSSLANSATPWMFGGLLVGLRSRTRLAAVAGATTTLWALEAGYVVGSLMKGHPSASSTVAFWLLIGAAAGPVVGLAADALARGRRPAAAVAVGVLAGIAVGEGVYGLTVVGDTTSAGYWIGEIALALAALVGVGAARVLTWPLVATAAAVTAATAVAFLVVYQSELLTNLL